MSPDYPHSIADFAQAWRVSRRIDDHLAGQAGHFSGIARISKQGKEFVYQEDGVLQTGQGAGLKASRRYLWEADGGGILIRFEDGRYFHHLPLGSAGGEARHDCAPDVYKVRYDFAGWPRWRAVWSVTGPRKNYVMTTDYDPATD